jgi:hypothetical protein
MRKVFGILVIAIAVVAAFSACNKDKDGDEITNTLTLNGKIHKIHLSPGLNDNEFNCDIHFVDNESDLANSWGMMWVSGKIGTHQLPAAEEDFMLTKNTYPDYSIDFKSGTAKAWIDGGLCIVVDGVLKDGTKLKLSVKGENN